MESEKGEESDWGCLPSDIVSHFLAHRQRKHLAQTLSRVNTHFRDSVCNAAGGLVVEGKGFVGSANRFRLVERLELCDDVGEGDLECALRAFPGITKLRVRSLFRSAFHCVPDGLRDLSCHIRYPAADFLQDLTKFQHLSSLAVWYKDNTPGEAFSTLGDIPNLQQLSVTGQALSGFPVGDLTSLNLVSLTLRSKQGFKLGGVSHDLGALSYLKMLSLDPISSLGSLEFLKNLSKLTHLSFVSVTKQQIMGLSGLQNLPDLQCLYLDIDEGGLVGVDGIRLYSWMQCLTKLTKLSLDLSGINPPSDPDWLAVGISQLQNLIKLKHLGLYFEMDVSKEETVYLSSLTSLETLEMWIPFGAGALNFLPSLPRLEKLVLASSKILCNHNPFELFGQIMSLTSLDLSTSNHEFDIDLSPLSCIPNLRILYICGCEWVGQRSMESLGLILSLSELDIGYTLIPVDSICHLKPLTKLQTLSCSACWESLSTSDLNYFAQIRSLTSLDLSVNVLEGQDLMALAPLTKLVCLKLKSCGIFEQDLMALKASLPDLACVMTDNVLTSFCCM